MCPDKKCPKFPFRLRWTHLLIFQLFCALFVGHSPVWANVQSDTSDDVNDAFLSKPIADANGDSTFNGTTEKLTITFTTNVGENQTYTYEIKLSDGRKITSSPDTGQPLTENQTFNFMWDGTVRNTTNNNRQALPDGDYRIIVALTVSSGDPPKNTTYEESITATIDKTKPTIKDVSVGGSEFSPDSGMLPVYYTLSENVAEVWLEIQNAAGEVVGRRIELKDDKESEDDPKMKGSRIFYWNGKDGNDRNLENGSYRLKINATDKGGNTAEAKTTAQITIDSEQPRITGITINDSIPLIDGSFVNTSIQTIDFTADAGSGTPLDFNTSKIQIRPINGTDLSGALTVTDSNKAVFTLGNPLDSLSENGNYEVTVFLLNSIGNRVSSTANFTFDNTVPTLIGLTTNREEFTQGSGLSGSTNYIEAELEDNIELDLPASSIRLNGPDGSLVLGEQTQISNNKIRWQLRSPLITTDGIQDGHYTVEIIGVDKATNRTETINITFIYDNLAPELVSLQPTRDGAAFDILGDTTYYNLTLSQFVATFNDGEFGTGVLFSGSQDTTSIVFGTPKFDGTIDALSGRTFVDKNNSVLTYILDSPLLSTDGSQDGTYVISIKAADALGNFNTINYQLIYDTQVPTLTSTVPAANHTVSSLTDVVIRMNEQTSGIDFAQSNYRLTRNIGENQVEVPVNIASNGTDTVTLTLLQQIALDGSDDGTYTIEVTPADNAGNVGAPIRRPFYLVSTTQPKVRLTVPDTRTVNNITDISVVIENYIGIGINFDDSNIIVTNVNGTIVSDAKVEHDAANNQLTWSTETAIPRNGTADGEYAIFVSFVDFTRERYTQTFSILLDTQHPSIETVETKTDPLQSLSIDSVTDINATFSQIYIAFAENDVDFENTVVSLVAPDSTEIPLHRSNDGDSVLVLNFQNLSNLGTYVLSLTPTDRIGNISQHPYVYKFDLEIAVPVVTTILIGGQSGAIVYVNDSVEEIVATLVDTTGIGLAIGDSESRIAVTSETGLPVPGTTVLNNEDQQNWQLIWRPIVLPTDGSGDGTYTVTVTPVDNAGRTGNIALRGFIYDTQKPLVTSASPATLHQPISYLGGSFPQLQFTIEDVGPASLELDAQTISLTNSAGETVSGQVTHDGVNQLFYTLYDPLPTDESADGEYLVTVNLMDRAGNPHQFQHNIFYDSQAPLISTVSLNTDTPLDLLPYQVTDLGESINRITVNFVESTRVDFENTAVSLMGPDGSEIPFNSENNGVDQLTANFVSLIQDGLYTLSVTAQDITGNSVRGAVQYPFRLEFAVPRLLSVKANTSNTLIDLIPHQIVQIDEVINQVTLAFTDPNRLDFEMTNVELLAPNGQLISLTQEENDLSQLSVRFISVTENGLYTLRVTPRDIAGNIAQTAAEYQFRLDIALPSVSSVLIDDQLISNLYVNKAISTIVATFIEPSEIGLDFSDDGSSITVTNESGVEVVGITQSNEQNQLTWSPLAFPSDGSIDGIYNVSVTPIDKVGRTGKIVNRQFRYDTQAPRIIDASPIELHQPTTYVGASIFRSLTQFQITIEDVGPATLDLDAQEITLHQSDGSDVSGVLTHDNSNRLYFTLSTPFPTDGSADGEYGLTVNLVDSAGNSYQTEYKVYYDSQAPTISSATLNTETPLNLTPYKVTKLTETVSKLTLRFVDSTRVDFADTTVTLTGPTGYEIPLTLTNNGVDELTANFVALTQGGEYTLSVTPQDIIGNVAKGTVPYLFSLEFQLPELTSVKVETPHQTVPLTPYEIVELTEVISSLILEFTDVMRIDIEETNVTLSGPDGESITVTLEEGNGSQLVVRFVPLEQNGMYSLSITPQDTLGQVAQRSTTYQFRLDFAVPKITSVSAKTADATIALTPFEIINITETVNSIGIGFMTQADMLRIDIENTNVTLSGPDGESITVTLEEGDGSQLVVRFVPLEQSGMYTLSITPQDISGHVAQSSTTYQFRLDFAVPKITSVSAKTADATIALTPFEIINITETVNSIGIGFMTQADMLRIDIENTNVTLSGPDGESITVTLEEGDGSQLVVRFVPLEQSGMYTLSITPQDISGHVAQSSTTYQFRLDFAVPKITSVSAKTTSGTIALTPYEIIEITETVSSIGIGFMTRADMMRIDIQNTNVTLSGPDGESITVKLEESDGSQVVVPQLVVRFVPLEQSGMYTLSITPQDISGHVAQSSTTYQFRLDFAVPKVTSVSAKTTSGTIALTPYEIIEITEVVNSIGIGFSDMMRIDIAETNVTLSGPDGEAVVVTLEEGDGSQIVVPQLVVRFVPLEQSGMYRLSITPQDTLGQVAQNATTYQFRLDFAVPKVTSVSAKTTSGTIALTPYEIIEITEVVNSIGIGFSDMMRIDIENTNVTLSGPDGEAIVVTLEEGDGSQIVVPQLVVRFVPLEQSGMYTLSITPQDTLGQVAQNATTYQFRLDLQVPGITSAIANVADTHVALTVYEAPIISNSFSSFTLEFTDAENLDDENTLISLSGPNGQEIAVTLEKGEDAKYVVRFVALTENGLYSISVTPQDKGGNVGQSVYQYQFRLNIALPTVQSISIDGKLGATISVSNSTPRIIASLTDALGNGLSFGDNGSTIVVTDSNGLQVPGTATNNDSNQLIWIPIPFSTDGSADGQYNVAVTPIDMNGRSGTVVNRNFIYDSQAPGITAASPITLHAPVSYIGSGLDEFILTIEDEGPAGFVLLSQVAALMDAANKPIPAAITHDDLTNQLYLTLSTPFANDGSADGTYTLNVALIDKAGNRKTSQYTVVYDSRIPQISSVQVNTVGLVKELVANEVTELSESISTITLRFSEATRVDFTNTEISLLDPSDLSVPLTIENDGVSEMTIRFPNLTEIGQYILSVTPQDIAGNIATIPIEYTFNLEFILPTVESIQIGDTITLGSGDIAYVNADNLVIVANLLDPTGTGLPFDSHTGSEITVTTLDGVIVFGSTRSNNSNVFVWQPITLSTDGSSDGRYAVYVTPIDKEGREGSTIYREFILDTQEPEITSASPVNLSQPVSYVSESLTQLQFTVQDVGPADLLLEEQQISLRNQNGAVIPTKLTHDSQNQLYLTLNEPLPLDGSMDGEYTVVIAFTDKAGNILSVEHTIIYDTQAPTLVNTVPDDGELLTEDLTQIVLNLNDEGESGIDWSNTTVTLIDPNGVEISGDVSSNGKTQLTLNTNQLVADGRYIIRVQAIDRAGNGNLSVFESSFLLSRLLPAVISTVPITAPEDEAYINEEVKQIEVMLQTEDARHLSTVRLLNADGQVVAGQQRRETGKLIYELVRPLATDGSEDGVYMIEFTPISASGRSGEVQSMTFTYDTQVPKLITDDIQLIVAEPEVNNSLVEIRVPITDTQAGVDGENLDDEWFAFEQLTPNRTDITGRLSYHDEQSILVFKLNVPLADNGSADGEYRITITPIDKAGNGDETYEKELIYDTSPPVIDSNTLLINDAPLLTNIDAEDYPSSISTSRGVVIQASITDVGLGVNLSQSSITIIDPSGQEISGTSQQNGIDTIVFKSDGLNIEGIYQVTITGTGNDSELLGFSPKDSITAAFLYETTEPTGSVTNDGGKTEFTDEAIPFEGTAVDPEGSRRAGQQGENEVPVPASKVLLVEIIGTGPDGQEIEPVPAKDNSNAQAQPWSRWSVHFLPTRSGEYDLDLRVTDKAGNYTIYDIGEYTMSVSFSFKGNTFSWPNPLRKSKNDVAFFSFDLNTPENAAIDMTLYIYDWGGDLVYKQKYANITTGQRDDSRIKWNLKNQTGNSVARGIYVFRLETVNRAGNRANAVGKVLVVD